MAFAALPASADHGHAAGFRLTAPRSPSGLAMPPRELVPVFERLKACLLSSTKINVDETTAPVLDPGRGRTKTGYFWAIARDDRPWQGPEPPGVAYTYAPGRGAVHALKLLDNYTGVVQYDGYAAYKTLTNPERKNNCAETITLAFCWSHLRRRFVEIERNSPAPAAKEALVRIGQLYAIERACADGPRKSAARAWQSHSKPLVIALKAWFEERLKALSAKAPRPRRSAMALTIGTGSSASSTMAASNSTPTPWNAPCVPSL